MTTMLSARISHSLLMVKVERYVSIDPPPEFSFYFRPFVEYTSHGSRLQPFEYAPFILIAANQRFLMQVNPGVQGNGGREAGFGPLLPGTTALLDNSGIGA